MTHPNSEQLISRFKKKLLCRSSFSFYYNEEEKDEQHLKDILAEARLPSKVMAQPPAGSGFLGFCNSLTEEEAEKFLSPYIQQIYQERAGKRLKHVPDEGQLSNSESEVFHNVYDVSYVTSPEEDRKTFLTEAVRHRDVRAVQLITEAAGRPLTQDLAADKLIHHALPSRDSRPPESADLYNSNAMYRRDVQTLAALFTAGLSMCDDIDVFETDNLRIVYNSKISLCRLCEAESAILLLAKKIVDANNTGEKINAHSINQEADEASLKELLTYGEDEVNQPFTADSPRLWVGRVTGKPPQAADAGKGC